MSDQTGAPPAGWYNDPTAANQLRWWDGTQWSSSTRPLVDGPTPPMPPPMTPAGPPPSAGPSPFTGDPTLDGQDPKADQGSGRSWMRVAGLALAGILLVAGCTAVLSASNDEAGDDGVVDEVTAAERDEAPTTGSEGDDEAAGADDDTPDTAGGPDLGTRDEPLGYDQPVELTWSTLGDADGSRWTTTVGPPRDVTDAVLAENEFNDPPPEGVRFVGFDAEMTLVAAAKEPLAPSFNISWEVFGGETARVYTPTTIDTESFGCGVTPDDFDDFAEVFAGGTLSGLVCIPIPTEDLDHPDTRVALRFANGDRAIFGP